jgi:hypothetical protein
MHDDRVAVVQVIQRPNNIKRPTVKITSNYSKSESTRKGFRFNEQETLNPDYFCRLHSPAGCAQHELPVDSGAAQVKSWALLLLHRQKITILLTQKEYEKGKTGLRLLDVPLKNAPNSAPPQTLQESRDLSDLGHMHRKIQPNSGASRHSSAHRAP